MFKVNNVMQNTIKYKAFVLLAAVIAFSGCRKIFNLPDEKNYLSTQADYTQKDFKPVLGRTKQYLNIFSAVGSTFPMTFEIKNAHFGDGRDASDMLKLRPVLVWNGEYSGKETSLAQIEAKRHLEDHPILETRGNGDLIWWYNADTTLIKPADSVVYPQNQRFFDIKITNSGGTRTIKNLIITPYRDIPYDPHDDYNIIKGGKNTSTPGGKTLVHMYATISGIRGETTNQYMNDPKNATTGIVYLYIRKFTDPSGGGVVGSRLRFKFLNKDSTEIKPIQFNTTKWIDQIHGFNSAGLPGPDITDKYVQYSVAYPIPVAIIPTKFTSGGLANTTGGDQAHVEFSYSRLGFGNVNETGKITLDFRIFEKADWEIVFHFKTVNPKFVND